MSCFLYRLCHLHSCWLVYDYVLCLYFDFYVYDGLILFGVLMLALVFAVVVWYLLCCCFLGLCCLLLVDF